MKNKSKIFIIQDWAGNHLFKGEVFKSIEDGWGFIYRHVDNSEYEKTGNEDDNVHQDYFVVPVKVN